MIKLIKNIPNKQQYFFNIQKRLQTKKGNNKETDIQIKEKEALEKANLEKLSRFLDEDDNSYEGEEDGLGNWSKEDLEKLKSEFEDLKKKNPDFVNEINKNKK
jgi:hypothetical protein